MNREVRIVKGWIFYMINFPFKILGFEICRLPMHGFKLLNYYTHIKRELIIPLNSDSLFIDVGGFEGMHTQAIYEEYGCNVICFEPAMKAFKKLEAKFYGIDKIHLERLAVTDECGKATLYHKYNLDGNSLYKSLLRITDDSQFEKEEVDTIDFSKYLAQRNITNIELLKLNCEGGEWQIMNSLIREKKLPLFRQILVQWHSSATTPDVEKKVKYQLNLTHSGTKYHPAWEIWTRK